MASQSSAGKSASVPWDPHSGTQQWRDDFAKLNGGWKPAYGPSGKLLYWRIEGDCPRCRHFTWAETGPGVAVAESRDVTVWCRCGEKHLPRPESDTREGCGPEGNIPGPTTDREPKP